MRDMKNITRNISGKATITDMNWKLIVQISAHYELSEVSMEPSIDPK